MVLLKNPTGKGIEPAPNDHNLSYHLVKSFWQISKLFSYSQSIFRLPVVFSLIRKTLFSNGTSLRGDYT